MRNYAEITERLISSELPIKLVGNTHGYPIHHIHFASSTDMPQSVLITGGVHGDEPAGVEAVLQFLERDNTALLKQFSFTIIPCINPYGYVHETRETRNDIDINRSFETDNIVEVAIVKKILGQTQFALAIDFHEDYEATGFYLYEGTRDEKHIGPQLAAAAKAIGPVDPEDTDKEAPNFVEGVYKVATEWGTQGLAPYLLHFHSKHVIISETPTIWQLERRAALHLTILDTALNAISERRI